MNLLFWIRAKAYNLSDFEESINEMENEKSGCC